MAALEGAEDGFATASGMAAVHGALFCQLKAGDHVVSARALFGSLPLHRRDPAAALRHRGELRRRHRPRPVGGGDPPGHQARLPRVDLEPDARGHRHRRGRRARACGRRAGDRRQRLRDADLPALPRRSAPTSSSIRRPSTSTARGAASAASCSARRDFIRGTLEPFLKHTGGALSPFNAWVMLKGLETLDLRCRAQAATAQRLAEALQGHPALVARVIYPGLPDHPQAELARAADGDRRHRARRSSSPAARRRPSASSTRSGSC